MTTTTQFKRNTLRGGSALRALALMGAGLTLGAGFAAPAFAQAAATQAPENQTTPPDTANQDQTAQPTQDIVVTGTIFRNASAATARSARACDGPTEPFS